MKQKIKLSFKTLILKNRKSKRLFYSYKSYGIKGIVFDLLFYSLVKTGLNKDEKWFKHEAVFLHNKSKHLNVLEKLFIAKKNIRTIPNYSFSKKLIKYKSLPLEEI